MKIEWILENNLRSTSVNNLFTRPCKGYLEPGVLQHVPKSFARIWTSNYSLIGANYYLIVSNSIDGSDLRDTDCDANWWEWQITLHHVIFNIASRTQKVDSRVKICKIQSTTVMTIQWHEVAWLLNFWTT